MNDTVLPLKGPIVGSNPAVRTISPLLVVCALFICVHSLQAEVAHKALVKRVRQERVVPTEKMLELLRPTQVIRDIEVRRPSHYLRLQHRADKDKRMRLLGHGIEPKRQNNA